MLVLLPVLLGGLLHQDRPFDVDAATPHELRELAQLTRAALTAKVLAVPDELREEHAAFLAQPGTGIARVLDRDSPLRNSLDVEEGGAFFDLKAGRHQYNPDQDIGFERGRLRPFGWGGDIGWVVDLGSVDLDELEPEDDEIPQALPRDKHFAWQASWAGISAASVGDGELPAGAAPGLEASVGRTFLFRRHSPRRCDFLAALEVLDRGADSCIFRYRILETWRVPHARAQGPSLSIPGPERADPRVRAWLAKRDREELTALLRDIERVGTEKLLAVPEELSARYLALFDEAPADSGFVRLNPRGEWDLLTGIGGGSSYYSFLDHRHGWQGRADLDLQSGGFAVPDGAGWILDLGAHRFAELPALMLGAPLPNLPQREAELWNLAFELRFEVRDRRVVRSQEQGQYLDELRAAENTPCLLGHTYLLRSANTEQDLVVVFTVLDVDDLGAVLAWTLLDEIEGD